MQTEALSIKHMGTEYRLYLLYVCICVYVSAYVCTCVQIYVEVKSQFWYLPQSLSTSLIHLFLLYILNQESQYVVLTGPELTM